MDNSCLIELLHSANFRLINFTKLPIAFKVNNDFEKEQAAEISRAQIWQWLHNSDTKLSDGREVTPELYRSCFSEELEKIKSMVGDERYSSGKYELASQLLDQFATEEKFTDFLTLTAL